MLTTDTHSDDLEVHHQLVDERKTVVERLEQYRDDLDGPHEDPADRAEAHDRFRALETTLSDIDKALDRIAEGTFGRCTGCGGSIPGERLSALPATATCLDCSARNR